MAELGRQLQEYVAQSKAGGGGGGGSSSSSPGSSSPPSPGWRAWLSPPGSSALSWSPVEPDPLLPGLSAAQRLVAAGVCAALAALCFGLAGLYAPLLLLRARKFSLLWSLGSALGLGSAGLLRGPGRMLREPWTLLYLAALGGTLYGALGLRSTALTLLGAAAQIITGAALLLGLLPGGAAGRRYISGLCGRLLQRGVSKALPV